MVEDETKNKYKPSNLSLEVADLLMEDFARKHEDIEPITPEEPEGMSPLPDLPIYSLDEDHPEIEPYTPPGIEETQPTLEEDTPPQPEKTFNPATIKNEFLAAYNGTTTDKLPKEPQERQTIKMPSYFDEAITQPATNTYDDFSDETIPYEFALERPEHKPARTNTTPENTTQRPPSKKSIILDNLSPDLNEEISFSEVTESVKFSPDETDIPEILPYENTKPNKGIKGFTSELQDHVDTKPADLFHGADVLEQICKSKREHIQRQKGIVSESQLRQKIYTMSGAKGFISAINSKIAVGQNALIAEIKKASPSKGIIRKDFEPGMIARAYEAGGATCLSVLTDTPYFHGRDEYINIVDRSADLPILRKDFILEPYQVLESRAIGADCILLIMAALSDEEAAALEDEAIALGMDVLVEVHDEEELERALKLKTMLIGINNRNLRTLEIDLSTTEKLAAKVPFPRTVVCESGIYTNEDIQRMNQSRVKAFLVGESLMSQDDITNATQRLLGII